MKSFILIQLSFIFCYLASDMNFWVAGMPAIVYLCGRLVGAVYLLVIYLFERQG